MLSIQPPESGTPPSNSLPAMKLGGAQGTVRVLCWQKRDRQSRVTKESACHPTDPCSSPPSFFMHAVEAIGEFSTTYPHLSTVRLLEYRTVHAGLARRPISYHTHHKSLHKLASVKYISLVKFNSVWFRVGLKIVACETSNGRRFLLQTNPVPAGYNRAGAGPAVRYHSIRLPTGRIVVQGGLVSPWNPIFRPFH